MTNPNNVTADELSSYENGAMDREEIVEMFQRLINSGLAWQLQGCYGRMAQTLIEAGECHGGV